MVTGSTRSLDRHFRKAARKLKKLQDIGLKPGKYAAKAAAYGVAAAGTGTIALAGTKGLSSLLRKKAAKLHSSALYSEVASEGSHIAGKAFKSRTAQELAKQGNKLYSKADAVDKWGNHRKVVSTSSMKTRKLADGNTEYYFEKGPDVEVGKSRNDKIRIAAGIATAGLGAASAVNAYRAKNYQKYRQKAVDFKNAMDEAFAGTKYEGQYVKQPRRKKKKYRG